MIQLVVLALAIGRAQTASDAQAIIELLRTYESGPVTLETTLELAETPISAEPSTGEIAESEVFRRQFVEWLSSGPMWRAAVREELNLAKGDNASREWTEYWDGAAFYRVGPGEPITSGKTWCHIYSRPAFTTLRYDVLDFHESTAKPDYCWKRQALQKARRRATTRIR